MQCPECGKLRHEGPCDDAEFEIEQLAMDADAALDRYLTKLREMEIANERRC